MNILGIRACEFRNVYCRRPVVVAEIALGDYGEKPTNQLEDFSQKLIRILPGLHGHYCSRGKEGGFIERLTEGTLLGHVVEHVALELQCLAGNKVFFGKTRSTSQYGTFEVVCEYAVKEVGIEAVHQAVNGINQLLQGADWSPAVCLEKLKRLGRQYQLGPSTQAIVNACRARGIPVIRMGQGSLLQLGYGCYQRRVQATITENTSCIATDIAGDKLLTKELLLERGLPVPKGGVARSLAEALALARSVGGSAVIKPQNGNQGKGVTLNLKSVQEITAAFQVAQNYSEQVLVEEYIEGRHYRMLVVGERVIATAERIPTQVTGDGQHSIKELIDLVNLDPNRGEEHEKPLTKIKVDPLVIFVLAKQGKTLEDIPAKRELVNLRENANLSTGGTAVDVTEEVHPDNLKLAVRAARAVGLDVAGVDIVTPDISQPLLETGGAFIEINAAPGIRMHHYPSQGQARDVAGAIVDSLFPPGLPSRIPVITVTGTNGKTTTTRLIGRILKKAGYCVGMTTTDGIYIDEEIFLKGDLTGPRSAQLVLKQREVTAAIMETARGGLLRSGLGYDEADVGVVTNISGDHLGQYNIDDLEDLAQVKSLVLEAVRRDGTAVINADDPLVAKMADYVHSSIIYFSQNGENVLVRRHLGIGGRAVFSDGAQLIFAASDKIKEKLSLVKIPLTKKGKAIHHIQNVLAGAAAAWGLGIELKIIITALQEFGSTLKDNPGRLEERDLNGVRVVLDYGHNPAGYEAVLKWAKKTSTGRVLSVIGVPGDRQDQLALEVGALAASFSDLVYIKEDQDLRGRTKGAVAKLLYQGALAAIENEDLLTINLSEVEAAQLALQEARPGDTVVVFYEKLEPLLEILETAPVQTKPRYASAVASGE